MYKANLSKSAATNNCIAFCETIKDAGYEPMIYANPNDFSKLINGKSLDKVIKYGLQTILQKLHMLTHMNTGSIQVLAQWMVYQGKLTVTSGIQIPL